MIVFRSIVFEYENICVYAFVCMLCVRICVRFTGLRLNWSRPHKLECAMYVLCNKHDRLSLVAVYPCYCCCYCRLGIVDLCRDRAQAHLVQ